MTGNASAEDMTQASPSVQAGSKPLSPRVSARTILVWLVLAGLLPGIIGASALLYLSYRSERAQLERNTIQTARALMQAVDAELFKAAAAAQVLARSAHLAAKDLAKFELQAKDVLRRTAIGNNVVLTDASGQQVLNTLQPFGSPLPRHGNPAQARRVFETGEVVISDIFIGGVLGQPLIAIDVPVLQNSKVVYDLSIGLLPEHLDKIVRAQQLPPGWVAAILDSQGVIASRSHAADQYVGQQASIGLRQRMSEVAEGMIEAPTLEGIPVSAVFSRSPASKWTVAIGIPTESLTAELRQRFALLLTAILVLVATGIALATLLADRIGRSIKALTGPALALGSGAPVEVPAVHLREAEEVGHAIATAARRLEQADADRRRSEARLEAHMGNSPLAIVEFDPALRVTRWSNEAERMFGWSSSEMLGRAIAEMRWVYDEDVEIVSRISAGMQSGAQPRNMCSNRNYRKDGTVVHCEWYNSALYDENGKLVSILSQVLDVTERDQAIAAISAARDDAEQANRAKSVFLATMSHEIRTPLHIITGLSYLLRHDLADPVQQERLSQLSDNADHLLTLVDDVLDLSRIEADRLILDARNFRLDAVVDRALEAIAGPARDKGLTLTANIAPALRDADVRGDPVRLGQILIKLGSNAVKFTNEGAIRLDAACVAENAKSLIVRFSVEDTGIGIAPEDRERLFRAFIQLDGSSTRAHSGSGLGLAICQRLVAMMGGKIEVQSQPGAGSRFSFELTLARAAGMRTTGAPTLADLHGLRVLFAEDNPLSQEILFDMLDHLGCEADVASNGAEAVACAQARAYDLILMDMQMPEMDGLDATRAIRALPAHARTPIIALTANTYAEDRQRCLDAGMDGHIGKPVTPATLAAALGHWFPAVGGDGEEAPPPDDDLSRALADIPGLEVPKTMCRTPEQLADYCALLGRFMEQHGNDMVRLREQLAASRFEAARSVAHNLKGIAGLIGVRHVATLAGRIDQELRAEAGASAIEPLIGECKAELARLGQALQAHLQPFLAIPDAE